MNDQEYWQGVEQCRERLWRIARMWLSDDSAAMDVVDEAVFRGWRACGRLRHPEYFTTWLTRILLNECSREKKRQDREQAVDQLPEQAWEDPGPPASEGGGPGTAGAAESSDPSALFLRLYFAGDGRAAADAEEHGPHTGEKGAEAVEAGIE